MYVGKNGLINVPYGCKNKCEKRMHDLKRNIGSKLKRKVSYRSFDATSSQKLRLEIC